MASKKTIRLVTDAVLTAMIVFEMFIQYTGEFLHEVIGFVFFATVVAHLVLSAKWIAGTASSVQTGKLSGRRAALAVMGILLAITMVVLGVSSVAISNLLAQAGLVWTLGSYATWATVHAVSSYALCALVVVHLGMHWAFLAKALRVPYNPDRRRAIGVGMQTVAAVGALALGVVAVNKALPNAALAEASGNSDSSDFSAPVDDVKEGQDTSSSGSSAPATGSTESDGSAGRSFKKKDKHFDSSRQSAPSQSRESTPPQESESTSEQEWEPIASQDYESNSSSNDSDDGSSGDLGICTLCRKQCPLSAPKCNKPYEAGLI